jgi:hypothetical protein
VPKKLTYVAAALLLAAIAAWGTRHIASLAPRRAAKSYISVLARGDTAAARSLGLGSAAFAAATLKGQDVKPAEVRAVDSTLAALGRGWALVEAEVELLLADGTADAGWYRLELVKADDSWKVVDFRAAPPRLSGVGLPAWGKDVEVASAVFTEYLRLLLQGEYAEAAKLAVGPARAAQEQQAQVFGKAPLFREVSEVSTRPLWKRAKYLALVADYRIDGRPVRVVALMYQTGQGWRVVHVREA